MTYYLISSGSFAAQVTSDTSESDTFQEAITFLTKRDCQAVWDILWKDATKGNYDALLFLVELYLTNSMDLPGWRGKPPAPVGHQRRLLALLAYASLSRKNFGEVIDHYREVLPQIISSLMQKYMDLGKRGDLVAKCYRSNSNNANCVELAIKFDLIPEYHEFVRNFALIARTSSIPASCPVPHVLNSK